MDSLWACVLAFYNKNTCRKCNVLFVHNLSKQVAGVEGVEEGVHEEVVFWEEDAMDAQNAPPSTRLVACICLITKKQRKI